jgi:predicted glycosyltransferase/nucleoside-diphosphate-sugar epimerase
VRGVDAFTETYPVEQKRDNVSLLSDCPSVELATADVSCMEFAELTELLSGVDAVVHLAGEPGVPASWGVGFRTYVERNVIATQRLLEATAVSGIRRFVYASSSSVYGPWRGPVSEASSPRPLSPYGATKLAGENLVGAYAQERGLSTVALRYFSVYGPRQRPDMAAHRFIEAMLDNRPLTVHGDGRQARDFTYVEDVVAATVAAVTADVPPATVLNVANGEPVEMRDVITMLAEQVGTEPRIDWRPARPGDTLRTEGRADAAWGLLGWEPVTDIRTGLERQVDWHQRRRPGQAARLKEPPEPPIALPRASSNGTLLGPRSRSRSRPAVRREPRLLIYSQDGLGLGHLRRTTLLATEFLQACPGASALTVSDSPLGRFFASEPGHDYCKLPSVRKNGPGDWSPLSLSSTFTDVLSVRRAMLSSAVEAFRPDVLLVDHMPHGAMGELIPALEALRDHPTSVVLGLRDILDAPAVVRERWWLEGAYEAVERYYDKVLVYGSPDVFDVAGEYGWPAAAEEKLRYCGYVCAPRPPGAAQGLRARFLRRIPDARLIVAMAGGGADAYPLFDTLLQAVPAVNEAGPCHLVVITGPFLPPGQRRDLAERAEGLPVSVLTSVSDPVSYLASADLVVAMAGYNTTAEILSVGTPALLIPREGPSWEQQMRARLFAERGWVRWIPPDDLSPTTLARAVSAAVYERPHVPGGSAPDLDGRTTGTRAIIESFRATWPELQAALPRPPGQAVLPIDRSLPA